MSSPRIPSDQEMELVKLEKNFLKEFKSVVSADHGVQETLEALAKRFTQSISAKKEMIAKMREIEALMKLTVTDPNARVTKENLSEYSELIARYAHLLDNNEGIVDGIKEILLTYRSFMGKKDTFYQAYNKYVDIQGSFQDHVYKYRKLTNKLETGDKVRRLEVDIRDEDNEITRQKDERVRQLASLVEEGKNVDAAWLKLKEFIKEFSF